jgi:hypothetical protein
MLALRSAEAPQRRTEIAMVGFIQIIEFRTGRVEEVRRLVDEMRDQTGAGTAVRGTVCVDRDRPGYFLNIVEFDSYESAMENSRRPEVSEFSANMAALCDEPPRFYNLDVTESWDSGSSTATKAAVAGTAAAVAGVAAAGVAKAKQRLTEQRTRISASRRPVTSTSATPTATTVTPTPTVTSTTTSGPSATGPMDVQQESAQIRQVDVDPSGPSTSG